MAFRSGAYNSQNIIYIYTFFWGGGGGGAGGRGGGGGGGREAGREVEDLRNGR